MYQQGPEGGGEITPRRRPAGRWEPELHSHQEPGRRGGRLGAGLAPRHLDSTL